MITVSTDGSALANPHGPMGWAWADQASPTDRQEHAHSGDCDAGGATNGTNQIGELCAVLEALRAHPGHEPLTIETDSQYAINCSTTWIRGWKRNGWRNSQNKPVKNSALIKAIDAELSRRPGSVRFVWVKGHAGNAGNERVDELARTYADDCRSRARDGYLPLEGWRSLQDSEYAKGLDVPSDARMLLEGVISPQDYHMARGASPCATDSDRTTPDRDHAEELPDENATADTSSLTAVDHPSTSDTTSFRALETDTASLPATDPTGGSTRTPITGDDLVPGNRTPGEGNDSPTPTLPTSPMPSLPSTPSMDSTENEEGEANKGNEANDAGDIKGTDDTDADTSTGVTDTDATTDDTRPTAPASTSPDPPAFPRIDSGLAVSGTLTFSPPPSSSATYDGRPRLVRGSIDIEGYVDGDGTITLAHVPFLVHRR